MDINYPQALAVLKPSRGCYLWIVPRCPLCGKRHQHGGGYLTGDPRTLLGHRVAHCTGPQRPGESRGYELVEAVAQVVAK